MTSSADTSQAWRKAVLAQGACLRDAVQNLNATALRIAMVVSSDGTLIGTLTDGDIRRGLLQGMDLNSRIDPIVQRKPLVATPQMSREMVLQLMRANQIHQVPVVDENRKVVGLHLLDEFLAKTDRPNLMVIMAGGKGMRLRPHTENCPKPLLPVAGKPMLEHIIERAREDGFRHFVLAIHYLGHMIEEYFADGGRWDVKITYLREEQPLGTAGALSLLYPHPDHPFLVSNGDVLADIRYGELLEFHLSHGASATMAVRSHEWQHPFGVVRTKGIDIVGFEEKPMIHTHINAGIYALEPEALKVLKAGEYCDMTALFERLRKKGAHTIVYPMHEPWLDVGDPEAFLQANGSNAAQD